MARSGSAGRGRGEVEGVRNAIAEDDSEKEEDGKGDAE